MYSGRLAMIASAAKVEAPMEEGAAGETVTTTTTTSAAAAKRTWKRKKPRSGKDRRY